MKYIIISTLFFLGIGLNSAKAQEHLEEISSLKSDIGALKTQHEYLNSEIVSLSKKNIEAELRISVMESINKDLTLKIDSLQDECNKLREKQKADKNELTKILGQTNEKIHTTEAILSSRTVWGICGIIILLIAFVAFVWVFMRKIKYGTTSIDAIRKAQSSFEAAQESIRTAHKKMQEETIQLDNKLIQILSNQTITASTITESGEVDHSLTLKVADEIVKIEMNLSHMDKSIKGYKQLSKGVQRIKDNFMANGYEIVDMLGKPYQAGMRVAVTFVTDETLESGKQIITRIIKPQVNYKQVMIQAAQIEVSQSE